jgi:oligopeptide/dipeptide ABC transporter ATP-binding protein
MKRLGLSPTGLVAAGFLLVVLLASLGAPLLAPYDPEQQDLTAALAGPSAEHWLGTDRLGRDVLSRLMYGGHVTFIAVVEAVAVYVVLGAGLGILAGYLGGWVDRLINGISDLLLALPGIIILLMVLAVFPNNGAATMAALGAMTSPVLLRVTRGVTLAVREELYVRAARLSGLTAGRIMVRHILPRLAGPITVQVFLFAATAVLVQSSLSFLGLATPETVGPSWGNMVAHAAAVTSQDLWLAVPTGGILVLTVLALGLLGDAVRDRTARRAAPTRAYRPVVPAVTSSPPAVPGPATVNGAAPLLSVRGLTIAVPGPDGPVTVVRDVDFDVAAGECVGLIGESGSGKTMIARSLLGLLPAGGAVTAGHALFRDRSGSTTVDLARLGEREFAAIRGRRIGLVSQEPSSSLDPSFRVGSQLAEVIRRHEPMSRRQARARVLELLATVRLADPERVARQYPHELSGGMAQRVSIALALAGNPALLVADEPTTALDVTVQAEILDLLRDLQARLGMAVLLVTHDWGVLADLGERAVVVYAGQVVEQASVDDIYRDPRHPYTRRLLEANPHRAPVGQGLPTIGGVVPSPTVWWPGCRFEPRCPDATPRCVAGPVPLEPVGGEVGGSANRLVRCVRAEELVRR